MVSNPTYQALKTNILQCSTIGCDACGVTHLALGCLKKYFILFRCSEGNSIVGGSGPRVRAVGSRPSSGHDLPRVTTFIGSRPSSGHTTFLGSRPSSGHDLPRVTRPLSGHDLPRVTTFIGAPYSRRELLFVFAKHTWAVITLEY